MSGKCCVINYKKHHVATITIWSLKSKKSVTILILPRILVKDSLVSFKTRTSPLVSVWRTLFKFSSRRCSSSIRQLLNYSQSLFYCLKQWTRATFFGPLAARCIKSWGNKASGAQHDSKGRVNPEAMSQRESDSSGVSTAWVSSMYKPQWPARSR